MAGVSVFTMFYFYIIHSPAKDKFYIGQTGDVQQRLMQHRIRKNLGADDWQLVYSQEFSSRAEAMQQERLVKAKKSRRFILDLILNQESET